MANGITPFCLQLKRKDLVNNNPERSLASSQTPAWEPLSCKLLLGRSSWGEAGTSKALFPSGSLGTSNKEVRTYAKLLLC